MEKMALNWTIIVQMVLFVAAMIILSRLLFRPMLEVFAKRETMTDQPYEEAEKLRGEAAEARKLVDTRLAAVRHDTEALRTELIGKAASEERDIVGEARQNAAEIAGNARADLEATVAEARQSLEAEAEELAESLANKLLEIDR
jgi:F-type H+-transporting ATPase subunit b